MANNQPPQYFANHLQYVTIDTPTLKSVLGELRAAVRRGIQLIQANFKGPDVAESEAFGTIAYGGLGIALMFLRLETQAKYLAEDDSLMPEFRKLAFSYLNPNKSELNLAPGRPTPLCHPFLGAIVLRILTTPYGSSASEVEQLNPYLKEDVVMLHNALQAAIFQSPTVARLGHAMGGDEVLLGRAGLLWALLNIRRHEFSQNVRAVIEEIFTLVPELMNAIIHAGKQGAREYVTKHGEATAFPLMWPWLDDYYSLGAMHGITGILTVLCACTTAELHCHLPVIAQTITAICKLSISHGGHLPMSLPPYPSSRPSPLVQICHGTPGLLFLLAAARGKEELNAYRQPEWNEAARLGSQRIWEEGLLSKGGGLCHGIAGNAWPWLILASYSLDDSLSAGPEKPESKDPHSEVCRDDLLLRALAFLLHARETQPFAPPASETGLQNRYRMPDNPYSLFEGLAGTICAWSEACVVITARLRSMEMGEAADLDSVLKDLRGFPGLGGYGGAFGLL